MAGGAIAGILIGQNLARLKAGIEAAPEAWKPLEARGLSFGSDENGPHLIGSVDGVTCGVHIVTDMVHNAHTEVTSRLERTSAATVGVFPSPNGLLKSVRDWLHQDVEIGAPGFDEAFLITSEPKEAAADLLTPAVQQGVVALAGGKLVGVTYGPDRIVVMLNGVEIDAAAIGIALDIVCNLAQRK
jgi:hypothetical protein